MVLRRLRRAGRREMHRHSDIRALCARVLPGPTGVRCFSSTQKRVGAGSDSAPRRQLAGGSCRDARVRRGHQGSAGSSFLPTFEFVAGDYASIDQAALTSESLPVSKTVGDEAYSGSVLKQAEMRAIFVAIEASPFSTYGQAFASTGAISHAQTGMFQIGSFSDHRRSRFGSDHGLREGLPRHRHRRRLGSKTRWAYCSSSFREFARGQRLASARTYSGVPSAANETSIDAKDCCRRRVRRHDEVARAPEQTERDNGQQQCVEASGLLRFSCSPSTPVCRVLRG